MYLSSSPAFQIYLVSIDLQLLEHNIDRINSISKGLPAKAFNFAPPTKDRHFKKKEKQFEKSEFLILP